MKTLLSLLTLILAIQVSANESSLVTYGNKDAPLEGYLVTPEKPNGAAVLIVHDWMGMSEKVKTKAKQVAELGYIAFAADIYGKDIRPQNQKEASEQAGKYKNNRKLFRERLELAYKELKKIKNVSKNKIAAIGFCFGGTGVIELARTGAKLNGIVSFHGGLDSPEPKLGKKIKTKVLVLHGADDPHVKEADMKAFEAELSANNVDYQIISYGGAVHSFTDKTAGNDPSKGAAYNENADRRSWLAMKGFFAEIF